MRNLAIRPASIVDRTSISRERCVDHISLRNLLRLPSQKLLQPLLLQNLTLNQPPNLLDPLTRLLKPQQSRRVVHFPLSPVHVLGVFPSAHMNSARVSLVKKSQQTYSGLCPTSINAACGLLAPVKVASSVGRAATTSGHHGLPVCGSLEARKTTKKASSVEDGNSRALVAFGRAKSRRIGIVLGEEFDGRLGVGGLGRMGGV